MKRKGLHFIFIMLLCVTLVGCKNNTTKTQNSVIKVNGSTSMEKFINGIAEVFKEDYPDISIEAQFTGSSAGIESVLNKTSNIGNSSRLLKDAEIEKGLVGNVVAIDGIVIVTNQSNTVTSLTTEQLIAIYKGEIRYWSEVGGDDIPIVVIGREAGSGTRTAFEELLEIENQCNYAQEINEAGAVVAKVESIQGAIGYVSLDLITDKIKAFSINGIYPTVDSIKSGDYILQRPFLMVTLGAISAQSQDIQSLFDFISSDKGKEFIKQIGLVPAS